MLNLVRDGGLFAPGVLDGHVTGLARIRAEYPWSAAQVSAHNDINPRNVLFDGERLWLVDWELAFRNDPLADARLTALTPDEFRAAITRGELRGTPELLFVLGKMHLAGFAAAHES